MWTLQEVVLAYYDPLMAFGRFSIPFQIFNQWVASFNEAPGFRTQHRVLGRSALMTMELRTITIAERSGAKELTDLDVNLAKLLSLNGVKTLTSLDFSLARLLIATANRRATDAKDHVFSLLGLLPKSTTKIVPDYFEDTGRVYQVAMVEAIQDCGNLSLLRYAAGPKSICLPSWCIDFLSA